MAPQPQPNDINSAQAPERGAHGFVASPLVTVLVGPQSDRKEMQIHQSIITSRSEFFANALSGRWDNSETKTIDLYEVDPDLTYEDVEHYLEVVYTSCVTTEEIKNDFSKICRLYVIAELLLDLQTRNLAIKALYERVCKPQGDGKQLIPGSVCVQMVYEGTSSAKDPMRRLLVDIWCIVRFNTHLNEKNIDSLPKEFLLQLAMRALEQCDDCELSALDLETYLEE